jgi:nucleotide-binding universal stress UspA family protein
MPTDETHAVHDVHVDSGSVDFSTRSRGALRHAVAIARRFGGRVTVMFVEDPLLLAAAGRASARDVNSSHVREWSSRDSSNGRLRRLRKRGTRLRSWWRRETPADEILRTARRLRNDLIVIDTQGLSSFQKLSSDLEISCRVVTGNPADDVARRDVVARRQWRLGRQARLDCLSSAHPLLDSRAGAAATAFARALVSYLCLFSIQRLTAFSISRSHSTELATAVQRSQSSAVKGSVENARRRNGA